jgi:hypothetical protein
MKDPRKSTEQWNSERKRGVPGEDEVWAGQHPPGLLAACGAVCVHWVEEELMIYGQYYCTSCTLRANHEQTIKPWHGGPRRPPVRQGFNCTIAIAALPSNIVLFTEFINLF